MYTLHRLAHTLVSMYLACTGLCTVSLYKCPEYHNTAHNTHIFLSENEPFPCFNGAILSIAQIIKFVMASAAKSDLAALFVTAREMIPHR